MTLSVAKRRRSSFVDFRHVLTKGQVIQTLLTYWSAHRLLICHVVSVFMVTDSFELMTVLELPSYVCDILGGLMWMSRLLGEILVRGPFLRSSKLHHSWYRHIPSWRINSFFLSTCSFFASLIWVLRDLKSTWHRCTRIGPQRSRSRLNSPLLGTSP